MNRCPLTYEFISVGHYSTKGLNKLSSRLTTLNDFPFSALEQRQEAAERAGKMSIQGVQPKLSVVLSIKDQVFKMVDSGGTFIVKPPSDIFEQVPENEDLTMKMAKVFGIEVPLTGLMYSKDGSLSYFIKRFDRYSKTKKYHVEDFAQLTGNSRDTKYDSSMEKLIPVLDKYCTFPQREKSKLFRRVLFCFLTGNEDMHLKNFSLISRNSIIELSPGYDLLNSSITMKRPEEEMALPIMGKKNKITEELLFEYYANERLDLTAQTINAEKRHIQEKKNSMTDLIARSFLSEEMQEKYTSIYNERLKRLGLNDLTQLV